jgi:hypothetical protein
MTTLTCVIPGCLKPHKSRGYCDTHYARWRKTGDPGTLESLKVAKPPSKCAAPDCESLARSSGALYCEKHYARMRRNGHLDRRLHYNAPGSMCCIDGCSTPAGERGMCDKHATRLRRHGDPDVCIQPDDRKKLLGPDHPAWTGDAVTYDGAHGRVYALKGSASNYSCVDCGMSAKHWSYDHADPDERPGPPAPYSVNPDHYTPRCVACHKRFDLDYLTHSGRTRKAAISGEAA